MLWAGNAEGVLCTYQATITKSPNMVLYHFNKVVFYKRVRKAISLELQSMHSHLMLATAHIKLNDAEMAVDEPS
eukprot:12660660-Ditylum_brightwellii.AAC.1